MSNEIKTMKIQEQKLDGEDVLRPSPSDGNDDQSETDHFSDAVTSEDPIAPESSSEEPTKAADRRFSKFSCSKSFMAKEISLEDVPTKIHNGSSIYIGSTAATAGATPQTGEVGQGSGAPHRH